MAKIAILGFGVVGQGVYEVLDRNKDLIALRTGESFEVKRILDLRTFPDHKAGALVTADINDIINDKEITVVAETMGGTVPAFDFSMAMIKAGKSVVTSNKAVVEKHGAALTAAAEEMGVAYLYEASAGGGIPVIHPLFHCLGANKINWVCGILNGTTNYILTKMRDEGISFETALKQAQDLGYAERDPGADVEGFDSARKICILAGIAFNTQISLDEVDVVEGITSVTREDVEKAERNGYAIKLVGYGEQKDGKIHAFVAPSLVKKDTVLGITDDVINAVTVYGDCVGGVTFRGRGAGGVATASAVVSDIIECGTKKYVKDVKASVSADTFVKGCIGTKTVYLPDEDTFVPAEEVNGRRYYRVIEIAE